MLPATPPAAGRRVAVLLAAVAAGTLAVHGRSLAAPGLQTDDFVILEQSLSWAAARANLWVPVNEHCWPVFRLATRLVVAAAGGAAALPLACALAVRVALLAAVGLVYLFVRRERNSAAAGVLAAAAFGVSAVYQEAVNWYAAAPAVGAAAFTLLGLLAAQQWVRGRRRGGLAGAGAWSFAAAGWFGGGVLSGPLEGLYLVVAGKWRAAAVPVAGTLLFLAVALPRSGDRILHADHHGGRTTADAFSPRAGATNTPRAVVDNLALGAVGVGGVACPPAVVVTALAAVAAGVGWWWRRAPRPGLVALGVAFVATHYFLVFAARAAWPYDTILHNWSRYNLFPWLGVVLGLAGGVRLRGDDPTGALSARDARRLRWVVVGLLVVQLPRGIVGTPPPEAGQTDVLRQVDAADERCRAGGIDAATAQRVLAPVGVPGDRSFNASRLLRGSFAPRDVGDAEAQRLLADE